MCNISHVEEIDADEMLISMNNIIYEEYNSF